jgi:hypothetical protein
MSQIEMAKNGKMSQIKRTLEAIFIKSISDVPQTEAQAAVNRDARVASRPRLIFAGIDVVPRQPFLQGRDD